MADENERIASLEREVHGLSEALDMARAQLALRDSEISRQQLRLTQAKADLKEAELARVMWSGKGVALIADERQRQIAEEHWTAKHDDYEHGDGALAMAACYYAVPLETILLDSTVTIDLPELLFPPAWRQVHMKRTPPEGRTIAMRVRDLVKGGALIAAEIDRLKRLEAREQERGQ